VHGAETWTLLKEDSCRLQAFHMTCQRRILGVRWNDFVTNRAVADSTNLPSILSTIAARRHSFFGHIRRLSTNTPAHKALKLAVDSKSGDIPQHDWNRPAGRPWTTWMSHIVRDTGLPTHGLLPTTSQRGGRYDPQPVTRSSDWVSVQSDKNKLIRTENLSSVQSSPKRVQRFNYSRIAPTAYRANKHWVNFIVLNPTMEYL